MLGLAIALFGRMARTLAALILEILAPLVDVRSLLAAMISRQLDQMEPSR